MQGLARVLLQMQALDAHHDLLGGGNIDDHLALAHDGALVLGDLIALGKVGVEVVLPVEGRAVVDLRLEANAGAHGLLDALLVDDGEHAGHGCIHQRHMAIGIAAELRGCAGEELGMGGDLGMDLHAHDDLPIAGGALDELGCIGGCVHGPVRRVGADSWRPRGF